MDCMRPSIHSRPPLATQAAYLNEGLEVEAGFDEAAWMLDYVEKDWVHCPGGSAT